MFQIAGLWNYIAFDRKNSSKGKKCRYYEITFQNYKKRFQIFEIIVFKYQEKISKLQVNSLVTMRKSLVITKY